MTTGFPYENGLNSEIIDVINPITKCDKLKVFPAPMDNTFGFIANKFYIQPELIKPMPIICGNNIEDSNYDCYGYFDENNITKIEGIMC